MPIYPTRQDDPRALALALAEQRRQLESRFRRRAGPAADTTPPPAEVPPGSLEVRQ